MKVKTNFVPDDCDYLTVGKEYTVNQVLYDEDVVSFRDDNGGYVEARLSGSGHLNGKSWDVIKDKEG